MESVFNFLLISHIVTGIASLILFWIPAFTKKGGKLHIQTGKVYVISMWIVLISAALMCGIETLRGNFITAAFLGFLSLGTAHPLWYAISILKQKKHISDQTLLIRKNPQYSHLCLCSWIGHLEYTLKSAGSCKSLAYIWVIGTHFYQGSHSAFYQSTRN